MNLREWVFSRKSCGILLVAALLVLGPVGAFDARAEPRAEVPETSYNFGQVREDMSLSHTFIIKNTGDQPLQILEVDPDCVCTVANYDRTIPPGGTGKITLELKPFSVVHAFKKKTYVRFNASNQPSVTLLVSGQSQRSIDIEPSHIVRFRGNPRDNHTAQVRFTSHMPFPWEITKFQNSMPDKFDVTLKTVTPGKVYVVEVKNKSQEEGHYVGLVELFTNAVHKPKIVMRVIADLYPDAPVAP